MRVLIEGSTGFIGGHVTETLAKKHEVIEVNRRASASNRKGFIIDLQNPEEIGGIIEKVRPEAIINCLGVVDASEDTSQNEILTRSLLEAVVGSNHKVKRIIISGSAAEYGIVGSLPVSEDTPLRASSGYGLSKVKEEETAKYYAHQYNLPVIVARVFNPIGAGMKDRYLLPNLIKQIGSYESGVIKEIRLSRLDSARDYVSVKDVANAYAVLIDRQNRFSVYNIGSGLATSNKKLLELIAEQKRLPFPKVVETSKQPEPQVASQANIGRMKGDFGWEPQYGLEETIKEVMHG